MRVFLLRHGTAAERDLDGGDDPARALVAKGHAQCRRVAELFTRAAIAPAIVMSSDYRRARETAVAVLDAAGLEREIRIERCLRPARPPHEAADLLRSLTTTPVEGGVLVVGHEPHLSGLAQNLLGTAELDLVLKKAGLIEIEFHDGDPASASLLGLTRPRYLRSLPGS